MTKENHKINRDTEMIEEGGPVADILLEGKKIGTLNSFEEPVNVVSQLAVPTKTDEEELQEFLNKEENRQSALRLANQIQEIVGKNWFTLRRFMNKTQESNQLVAFQKIKLCQMFGLMQSKVGDYRDGGKNVRLPMFKVTISNEDVIVAYQTMKQYHQDQVNRFDRLIKNLQDKICSSQSSS